MPAFIVKKIQAGREGMAGSYGRVQTMVYASTRQAAKAIGAEDLGVSESMVEVEEYLDDVSHMAVQTRPGHEFDPNDVEEVIPELPENPKWVN